MAVRDVYDVVAAESFFSIRSPVVLKQKCEYSVTLQIAETPEQRNCVTDFLRRARKMHGTPLTKAPTHQILSPAVLMITQEQGWREEHYPSKIAEMHKPPS